VSRALKQEAGRDVLTSVITDLLTQTGGHWTGRSSELLAQLQAQAPDLLNHRKWPKNAQALSCYLRRVQTETDRGERRADWLLTRPASGRHLQIRRVTLDGNAEATRLREDEFQDSVLPTGTWRLESWASGSAP
jgi:hypothetical protein